MNENECEGLKYSLFDPTGNITALVESPVEPARRRETAAALMARLPAVEQVGFVRFGAPASAEGPLRASLRMAGGEFCGNASMSAAALCLLRLRPEKDAETVWLSVSGTDGPVEVRLEREETDAFRAAVRMPPARSVSEIDCRCGALAGKLPFVRMEGIGHLIVGADSPFFALRRDGEAAGRALRALCAALDTECLGLLFIEEQGERRRMDPLVYVPLSGTMVWENSCASGSAAFAMYLAAKKGEAVAVELSQPGGVLRAESDPQRGETWLIGRTRLLT